MCNYASALPDFPLSREKPKLSARFSAGVAVVLGKTKETGTGVATESVKENVTEKILLVGKLQERLEDTDNAPGAGRGKRNAPENGRGREITETDTANLVSPPLIDISILVHSTDYFVISSTVWCLSILYSI